MKAASHRSRLAVGDAPPIRRAALQQGERSDGHDFADRAGDENFVRGDERVDSVWLFAQVHTLGAGDVDQQRSRDALEHAEREGRRHDGVAFDAEDVRSGRLGDLPFDVEHQRIVRASSVRLAQGEDAVQVVAGLERGVERLRRVPPRPRHRHSQPALVLLRGRRLERLHQDDEPALAFREVRRQTEATLAARDHEPGIRFWIPRCFHRPRQLGLQRRPRRERDADARSRPLHAGEMPAQLEDAAPVGSHHVVDRIPVEESSVQHGDESPFGRNEAPFDVQQCAHASMVLSDRE